MSMSRKYLRCYSLDHYSALWTSLQVKPETVKVSELLSGEMDAQAQSQLVNIWRKSLRDHGSISRITSSIASNHTQNSDQIWKAVFTACAHQSPEDLSAAYIELEPKLAEIPSHVVDLAIKIVLQRPLGNNFPSFMDQIPIYILLDLVENNIKLWSVATSPNIFAEIVTPLARRGSFPKSMGSVEALKLLDATSRGKYIDAVTHYLQDSKVCTALTTRLCQFIVDNSPPPQLIAFIEAAKQAQQAPNKSHPLSTKILSALERKNVGISKSFDPPHEALAKALCADTVPQAYNNIVNYGPKLLDHPRDFTNLYANWLRCCARDSPHDLLRFYESARSSVFRDIGQTDGRERVLLSGVIKGLLKAKHWNMIQDFLPKIKKTNTAYLWNAALSATQDWSIADEMREKGMEISNQSMHMLISKGSISDFKRLVDFVGGVLPPDVVGGFLEIVNKKNMYGYDNLIKFYHQVFDILMKSMKSNHDFVYPIINSSTVEQIVWGVLRTKPKHPWVVTHFLKEYVDLKLMTKEMVASGISGALEALQSDNGTAQHIRTHSSISVPQLVNKFNAEWKNQIK